MDIPTGNFETNFKSFVGLLGTPLTIRLTPTVGIRKIIAINVFMVCGAAIYSTIVSTFLGLMEAP
jgi:hypothetical protein